MYLTFPQTFCYKQTQTPLPHPVQAELESERERARSVEAQLLAVEKKASDVSDGLTLEKISSLNCITVFASTVLCEKTWIQMLNCWIYC